MPFDPGMLGNITITVQPTNCHAPHVFAAGHPGIWLKRNLVYDPVKEEFVNDPEANRLRSRAMRAPWVA